VASPLIYWYGHVEPNENAKLYKIIINKMAEVVNTRIQKDPKIKQSGIIVNTQGWVDGEGKKLLFELVDIFNIDIIFVLGHDRLYNEFTANSELAQKASIIKLTKSGGVVARDNQFRKQERMAKIHEYFYGENNDLSPYSQVIAFKEVNVFRIGGGPQAPQSALPIGARSLYDATQLVEVTPDLNLLHSLLAVSYATDAESILESNIAGFVYVTDIDTTKGKMTCLAPSPAPLPSRFMIVGSIKFLE